jgi:hypothetical protein
MQAEDVAAFFDVSSIKRPRDHAAAHAEGGGAPSRTPALLSVEGRTHHVQVRMEVYRVAHGVGFWRARTFKCKGVHSLFFLPFHFSFY